jgi:hypothetical protein
MEFEIRESLDNVDAEAIVVPISEGADPASPCDARFAATASMLFSTGDLPLKPLETLMIPGAPKLYSSVWPKRAMPKPGENWLLQPCDA